MCGRYALALRPSEVRRQLAQSQMPVDDAPQDDSVRHTYNFAPGNHGLVYRADGPDHGDRPEEQSSHSHHTQDKTAKDEPPVPAEGLADSTKYKLQAMKWGLVPFWTKRDPDFGSMMKTINCRDDSLYEDRGMWTSMKKHKRCIVVAQGFYEWLKKNNGKEKLAHFTKRKDGQLMCFAGLWDCVQYEDSGERLYTYTVITTDSNKQLKFLHDRMPVILENGSEATRTWLDPARTEWSRDLQSLLTPFEGELECYQVSKEVGKVGTNSPAFIVPIHSAANKSNIANFFGNQQKAVEAKKAEQTDIKVEHDVNEARGTTNRVAGTEDNAPLPIPAPLPTPQAGDGGSRGVKREHSGADDDDGSTAERHPQQKRTVAPKNTPKAASKKATRSATSNGTAAKASKRDATRKITSFFSK
ncbi:DUF159-domain-containing protein [Massarina eburnea CBS 473.64]|uniref:DUF159-domain-containing protein n=1 Tax=Massarina eburnea CBS 473.64 TaxID=1395130 RepID=A0A6A6S760_9PLEO|nr:DUF159-domain-containing protein [Massarina eburnea CBS 473.64]